MQYLQTVWIQQHTSTSWLNKIKLSIVATCWIKPLWLVNYRGKIQMFAIVMMLWSHFFCWNAKSLNLFPVIHMILTTPIYFFMLTYACAHLYTVTIRIWLNLICNPNLITHSNQTESNKVIWSHINSCLNPLLLNSTLKQPN